MKETNNDSTKEKTLRELHDNIMKIIKYDRDKFHYNKQQIEHDIFTHINMSQLDKKQIHYLIVAFHSDKKPNSSASNKASQSASDAFKINKVKASSSSSTKSSSTSTNKKANDSAKSQTSSVSNKSHKTTKVNSFINKLKKNKSSATSTSNNTTDKAKPSTSDINQKNDEINHKILSKSFSNKNGEDDNKNLLNHNKATEEVRKKRTMARKYHVKPQDLIDIRGNGLKELKGLVGLSEIKKEVNNYIMYALVAQQAEAKGMKLEEPSLNMIFKGSPGTGKTMVARLVGKILFQNHVIQKPLLHEISAKDLISGVVGGSSKAANKAVKQSVGGILFVDEAHVLAPGKFGGNEDSSKKSALSELMRETENYRGRIVVILAGYKDAMDRLIANGDQGMRSRFSHVIMFPDYTNQQMINILKYHAKKQNFKINCLSDDKVQKAIVNSIDYAKDQKDNSNGRFMRNLLQNIITAHFCDLGSKNFNHIKNLNLNQLSNINKSDVLLGISKINTQEENSNKE